MKFARDMRDTRFYKDAYAEGYKQGYSERFHQGIIIGAAVAISRRTGVKIQVADIAVLLDEDPEIVLHLILKLAPDCLESGLTVLA